MSALVEVSTEGSVANGRGASGSVNRDENGAKLMIPNGSLIRGRIRRVERYDVREAFIVGLEFTEVEVHGGRPLLRYADLLRVDNRTIKRTLSK